VAAGSVVLDQDGTVYFSSTSADGGLVQGILEDFIVAGVKLRVSTDSLQANSASIEFQVASAEATTGGFRAACSILSQSGTFTNYVSANLDFGWVLAADTITAAATVRVTKIANLDNDHGGDRFAAVVDLAPTVSAIAVPIQYVKCTAALILFGIATLIPQLLARRKT
jgi:hypothetical protein